MIFWKRTEPKLQTGEFSVYKDKTQRRALIMSSALTSAVSGQLNTHTINKLMKQIIQHLGTGRTELAEVPAPMVKPGHVLIKSRRSLVSTGTEKMLIDFGRSGLFQKIIKQPEKARMVLDKVRSDGLLPVLKSVRHKLDETIPLGYCNTGVVIGIGGGVDDLRIGDRVVSNGPHAEVVCVPRNLVAPIPENVGDQEAVFTVPAAIGLQAIRLMNPLLGETVVVMGLGLVGLLTAQLLRINGCRVVGVDINETKVEIARTKGIMALHAERDYTNGYVEELTNNIGADGVIIAASVPGNSMIRQAAELCRKGGKVVLIGSVGLDIPRKVFYEKELSFQVSRSYGPGRYDRDYEEKNRDYPVEYVRWTANRHFQTILQLLASGTLEVSNPLIRPAPLTDFGKIYSGIMDTNHIHIFEYPEKTDQGHTVAYHTRSFAGKRCVAGIIGAGHFATQTLLPNIETAAVKYMVSERGLSGTKLAKKYRIPFSSTDYKDILNDPEVNLVMIATRHDQHAGMVIDALNAGKHVFVEKPLAIFSDELEAIIHTYMQPGLQDVSLTVGFNRRFSPYALKMKFLLGAVPMNVIITVNAGKVAADSLLHDRNTGGGRIIGEACHFLDFVSFLTGSAIIGVCTNAMGTTTSEAADNVGILLKYENGSTGAISYFSNGHVGYPKERIEVHAQGRTLILDNFRALYGYGFRQFTAMKGSQDKGHKVQFSKLFETVRSGGEPLVPLGDIVNTTTASFAVLESLKTGSWVMI